MNKPMKYIFLFSFVFVLQTSIFAQSKVILGEEEIRKSPYTKFENRSDQFATPKRKAMEVEIGKGLHSLVIETDKPINYKGFTLQRFYSDEPGKFGGDILVLNKNARYGHINSIKRILNAYIQTSFEYTEKNADKLVMEVLYYNAQNRQKLDRIKKRYTKSLIAALNKNKVGIGKKFSDWPGNTQIVIPIKSQAETKTDETVEKKSDDKKENSKTDKTPPVTEKEKIKVTKEKIPSSDMSKENITNTSKTSNEKKSTPSDEPIVKEEKKVIETRTKDTTKDSILITESEMKQPEKNKTTTNSSESKTPVNSDNPDDKKDTLDESKVDKKNENTNKDEKKTSSDKPIVNESKKEVVIKEENKKISDQTPPAKTAMDQRKKIEETKSEKEESKISKETKTDTVKDNSKKVSEQNPPTKTTTDQSKKIEETKSVKEETKTSKETKTEVVKDESKKTTEQIPPAKTITDKDKTEEKKTTTDAKETPKKEEKVVEVVKKTNPETSKEAKSEDKNVTVKDTKQEEQKKEPSKTVALNETKTVTTDKPVVKEVKTVEPPKKAEEVKKETPKKETVVNLPAKVVEDKVPVTKTEIKKMHKELVELKAKEKDKVENSENVVGEKIVFLKVKEFLAEGHYTSEMWAVDTENDDELFQSPFKKVCGKEFKELDTGVVVMSFKDNDVLKTDTHHLALLDKDNLKLIKQSQEVIFWRSFVKEQSGKIYAIEFKDGKYYLAQFKNDLTFEMRSSDPINPDCEIAFKKNKIYLTKRAGAENAEVSIRVLNRDNLKLRDVKLVK